MFLSVLDLFGCVSMSTYFTTARGKQVFRSEKPFGIKLVPAIGEMNVSSSSTLHQHRDVHRIVHNGPGAGAKVIQSIQSNVRPPPKLFDRSTKNF
jgi:hypothetical protein